MRLIQKCLCLALGTLTSLTAIANNSFEALKNRAKSGDPQAQEELGETYIQNNDRNDLARGLLWLHKSAQSNNTSAMYKLGRYYQKGEIVKRNHYQAYSYFKTASANNHQESLYRVAVYLSKGIKANPSNKTPAIKKDEKKSLAILNELIEKEYAPALAESARLYLSQRIITPENAEKAYTLLMNAVKQNNSDAMVQLADCLYRGVGCKPDTKKMIHYLKKASQLNNSRAQARLAYCYENGIGLPPDSEAAFRLYKLSAESNNSASLVRMAKYYITGDFVKHDFNKALHLYKVAAAADNPNALYKLALFSLQGIGEKKDAAKAAQYLQRSAGLGFAKAQHDLAELYQSGRGVEQNEQQAFNWHFEAAKQNNNKSQLEIAFCYKDGRGIEQSKEEYEKWLKVAAVNGNLEASKLLSR